MIKFLLTFIFLFTALTFPIQAHSQEEKSSSLLISSSSDFSTQTTNFSPGQTIYVKVNANSQGTEKRQLNLRDNSYNLINTYQMEHIGQNVFKSSFNVPSNSGTYSLEARIESPGSSSVSVKTIKVGEGQSGNVKVDVKVNQNGSQDNSSDQQTLGESVNGENSPSPEPEQSASPSPTPEGDNSQSQPESFAQKMTGFFKDLFSKLFKFGRS